MNRKQTKGISLLLCAILLLTGCSPAVPMRENSNVTLPPAKAVYQAPEGDEQRDKVETVLLYLPSASTGQLTPLSMTMALAPNRHPAETALSRLLSYSGSETVRPLLEGQQLEVYTGSAIEILGSTATVNLGAGALALDSQQMLTVCRAITNTLTQWNDIRYVNILIASRQPGIDITATLPMGSLRRTQNEEALWDIPAGDTRFTSVATLYYPANVGKGVLAEARAVTFASKTMSDMVMGLLTALSADAPSLHGLPDVPSLDLLLAEPVIVSDSTTGGGRVVSLHFQEAANEVFINAGIPRSVMMASIVLTLTTFLPNISGVSVRIGQENVRALVPTGVLEGGGQEILFQDGIMRRADFTNFLLNMVPLYFDNGEGRLARVQRPLPYYRAQHVRALFEQLLGGPEAVEITPGLKNPMPGGITSADLIGFTVENDTVLVNLSENFLQQCQGLSPQQETLVIYSLVNTFCELRGIRRVRFYVAGQQPETLSGALYLPGEFLFNPNIIQQ